MGLLDLGWKGADFFVMQVNGMLTYDRRIVRMDVEQWKADIQGLYDAAKGRTGNATADLLPREGALNEVHIPSLNDDRRKG